MVFLWAILILFANAVSVLLHISPNRNWHWLQSHDQSTASITGHSYVYVLGVEGWQNLFLFILFSDNQSVVCIDWCIYTWHVTRDRAARPESGNPGGEENVTQPGISQFGQVISVPDIWVLTSDEAMLKMLSITHWSETNLATRTN